MKITQFGSGTYDTKKYPYVLLNHDKVFGRFSTLEKAHKGRLTVSLTHPNKIIMLFNTNTQKFIDWRRKERIMFEQRKE